MSGFRFRLVAPDGDEIQPAGADPTVFEAMSQGIGKAPPVSRRQRRLCAIRLEAWYRQSMPIGPWELLIILLIVLLLFGAKRVPAVGRSLGTSLREFKEGLTSPFEDDPENRENRALKSGEAPGAAAAPVEHRRERASS